jgi:translation initiation factor 3 subunit C
MSRFFRGGDDSSSDSSSDEEELYSEEEEEEEQQDSQEDSSEADSDDSSSDDEGGRGINKFLKDASSDSEDSDDEVRAKVKSAKDKRLDELESSIKQIENGQKNGDWTLISAGTRNTVEFFFSCRLFGPKY